MTRRCVVTGGGGFIGAYLVKRLVNTGWSVVVVDNMTRGDESRFAAVADQVALFSVDVRNAEELKGAFAKADVVFHLAAVNGTENFYQRPELVLDVGLRGALAVVEACRSAGVQDLVVASSAEVYQTPAIVPTDETAPLTLPDSLNPRYSYGGSKIVSELIAFNYGKDHFNKVQVFRPHNVYGPNMGWKHVAPQFIMRALDLKNKRGKAGGEFPIQGDGLETRAFAYVDDVVEGIIMMYEKGAHREIYHIGNDHEVSIRNLVGHVGDALGVNLQIQPGAAAIGATPRRCPDISKMRALGYAPKVGLQEGIRRTVEWYIANADRIPENELM